MPVEVSIKKWWKNNMHYIPLGKIKKDICAIKKGSPCSFTLTELDNKVILTIIPMTDLQFFDTKEEAQKFIEENFDRYDYQPKNQLKTS